MTANHTISEDSHDHHHGQNRWAVIPTAEKLGADPRLTGRGVTIAFLDSGFFPHPDFAARVIEFHDIAGEESDLFRAREPEPHHWHGTQTVVACAGDGGLSDGIYKGLASEANLVLVKVSREGRISDREIEEGLRWIAENHRRLNIRILNISLGGDADVPTADSVINRLAGELTADGVFISVAAGNSEYSRPGPPASAPSVLTVGGYSDGNGFDSEEFDLYHSSFGETADGLVKPEVIAPAMFVAAPILPGTADYVTAEALSELAAAPDYLFGRLLPVLRGQAGLGAAAGPEAARAEVETLIRERKIVAAHYQHVDGTSFAAPIAASVAAQMIEANPRLTPAAVRNILISTAGRLGGHPAVRQGYGILNAKAAADAARAEMHALSETEYSPPRVEGNRILFSYHDDTAETVHLVGDFNEWDRKSDPFRPCRDGLWCASVPCRPAGRYRYKILVNGERWTEDVSHLLKEEDGFGGFNSVLELV